MAQLRSSGARRRGLCAPLSAVAALCLILIGLLGSSVRVASQLGPEIFLTHERQDGAGSPSADNDRSRYGDNVTSCSLTVLVMDPRIPYFSAEDAMYTSALESVAEHAPADACILLQVSSCVMEHHLLKGGPESPSGHDGMSISQSHTRHNAPQPDEWNSLFPNATAISEEIEMNNHTISFRVLQDALWRNIRDKSGPLFGSRMDEGRVRITLLDPRKYGFDSCLSFYRPSPAWLNYNYYSHEFIDGIDSDHVLFFERDGVLCRPLAHLQPWRSFAYVGGPITSWLRGPSQVQSLKAKFDQVKGRAFIADWIEKGARRFFPEEFYATFPVKVLVGNGGVSLRSRKWMQRAIRTCPHDVWSGLDDAHLLNSNCTVFRGDLFDDFYFAVVLRLISAPVPHPFVASLFSADTLLPDRVVDEVGPQTEREQDEYIAEYWGNGPESVYGYRSSLGLDGHALPIAIHKARRTARTWKDGGIYYQKLKERCKYVL